METRETEEKSELLEDANKPEELAKPDYSVEEVEYLGRLMTRFESSITIREQPHEELDGMTYSEYWDSNEKMANTFIEPKKNKQDSNFQSGTARDKMLAVLAAINNLNLSLDISAFDENNIEIANMGEAMEDIILKTQEMDEDEEKKFLRQYELLKQGTVFTEEVWDERWMMDKKVQAGGKFTGQVKGLSWISQLKRICSKPSINVLNGLSVFLGNYRQYFITLQPYIFTLEITDYYDAQSKFGKWERWAYVPKTFNPMTFSRKSNTLYENAWKTLNVEAGQAVIIRYQDKWSNEAAVWINGVLMTPVGLPLTLVNGFAEYNITQQNFEPFNIKFAIGNSLMRKLRTKVGLLDEMLRMAVLKTQKSYAPPKLNFSGRILSSKIFAPAQITSGVPRDSIVDLDPNQSTGVTSSELAMINEMKEQINSSSVSPTFQGQSAGGDQTATEIVELQRQAKLVLGLTIFSCALLEWKISWLRLFNVLAKWFDPIDQKVDETRNMLVDQYRTVNQRRPIDGEGMGNRMVIPVKIDEQNPAPTPDEVNEAEKQLKERSGKPTRITIMNVEAVKSSKNVWQISIKPREKPTSELSKLMFRAELADAQLFGPMVNMEYMADKFAHVWSEDSSKMFKKGTPPPQAGAPISASGVNPPIGNAPTIKV